MKNFDTETIDFIENNNLIGIKAGNERLNFLNIWMVTVDNRIFARSWGFAERSWYNTFLKDADGEIKCRERVIKISAVIPKDIALLNKKINEAYLKKYDSGNNSFYAHGIIKEEHIAKTMEFIVL
ncbi:DUF2255 family protein [Flavobacterium sp. AJR]|uniref:DUF2255 family protein n=1 Tax=Flavobacterium sp. AJR TaxID=1979369 RepID=UPI000A3D6CD8|nr:DUF2255 family protein [Flavobacterium sp. AJR]OUL63073.1 hypothetical protein B8T70_06680 [Flavobacterium sp. AJR]